MIQVIRSERYLMRTRRVDNNEFAKILHRQPGRASPSPDKVSVG